MTGPCRLAILLCVTAGCAAPEGAPEERRETWAAERKALEMSLDRLEERLLVGEARVALWEELRERHGTVSEVACANLGEHARAVAKHEGEQREKRAALKKSRVATRLAAEEGGTR